MLRRYWNLTNNIGKTLRRGVPSSTPETLPVICEENREELARVCGVTREDVVMTWVSEMQETVRVDNDILILLCIWVLISFLKSQEGLSRSRKKSRKSSTVKNLGSGFVMSKASYIFTACCLKSVQEVYLMLSQLLSVLCFQTLTFLSTSQ